MFIAKGIGIRKAKRKRPCFIGCLISFNVTDAVRNMSNIDEKLSTAGYKKGLHLQEHCTEVSNRGKNSITTSLFLYAAPCRVIADRKSHIYIVDIRNIASYIYTRDAGL